MTWRTRAENAVFANIRPPPPDSGSTQDLRAAHRLDFDQLANAVGLRQTADHQLRQVPGGKNAHVPCPHQTLKQTLGDLHRPHRAQIDLGILFAEQPVGPEELVPRHLEPIGAGCDPPDQQSQAGDHEDREAPNLHHPVIGPFQRPGQLQRQTAGQYLLAQERCRHTQDQERERQQGSEGASANQRRVSVVADLGHEADSRVWP